MNKTYYVVAVNRKKGCKETMPFVFSSKKKAVEYAVKLKDTGATGVEYVCNQTKERFAV